MSLKLRASRRLRKRQACDTVIFRGGFSRLRGRHVLRYNRQHRSTGFVQDHLFTQVLDKNFDRAANLGKHETEALARQSIELQIRSGDSCKHK
jgi:hypothetical protein